MSLLDGIFPKKEKPSRSYSEFWKWFQSHEKIFYKVVKQNKDIEKSFFEKLSPKLDEIKDGFFYLTGMYDDTTVELIFTADGNTKMIAFVEEIVASAPEIKGWKFTALKPALEINDVSISMAGYEFGADNLKFYANEFS